MESGGKTANHRDTEDTERTGFERTAFLRVLGVSVVSGWFWLRPRRAVTLWSWFGFARNAPRCGCDYAALRQCAFSIRTCVASNGSGNLMCTEPSSTLQPRSACTNSRGFRRGSGTAAAEPL